MRRLQITDMNVRYAFQRRQKIFAHKQKVFIKAGGGNQFAPVHSQGGCYEGSQYGRVTPGVSISLKSEKSISDLGGKLHLCLTPCRQCHSRNFPFLGCVAVSNNTSRVSTTRQMGYPRTRVQAGRTSLPATHGWPAVSQPTWTMCPTTEDGTQCGGHGYCDFTYPLTAPGVCRCHQDDDLGYWNGTVCDDCDRRHHGWRCRLPARLLLLPRTLPDASCGWVSANNSFFGSLDAARRDGGGNLIRSMWEVRCHTEHGVCEYPLCCGRLGLGRCSACHPGFYGRDCSNPVSCQPTGICLEGSCYGLGRLVRL